MIEKERLLVCYLAEKIPQGICLAFSGGVDSALLLKIACEEGKKQKREVYAVTFQTKLHPAAELAEAKKMAEAFGAVHKVIEVDEFSDPLLLHNPLDRCYRCKKLLFTALLSYAKKQELGCCIEGTNLDDLACYRPGIRAVKELGIESPLAQFGFTKAQVRAFAAELKLSCSAKPSAPCLATRLPYGATLEPSVLERIDAGERFLKEQGFPLVRLRLHGEILRIEVPVERLSDFLDFSPQILPRLKQLGFRYLTLDLEGFRSGSMDLDLTK